MTSQRTILAICSLPILACGGCGALAFLLNAIDPLPTVTPERATVSAETKVERIQPSATVGNYNKLAMQMTYDEVLAIVGPPSAELSRSEIGGTETVMYQWSVGFAGSMNCMFQNGLLINKAAANLPN